MKKFLFVIGLFLAIGLFVGAPGTARALPVGNYTLEFVTDSANPGSASISYAGTGGALTGLSIPVASVDVMGQGASEALSGVTFRFTSGSFQSYAAGTWTFASGGTLSVWQGGTELYGATMDTANVLTIGGTIRIAAAALNTSYVNGNFFEPLLNFKATPDTITLGDLNQTFYGVAFTKDSQNRTLSAGPGIHYIGLSTGGVEGPVVPIPPSALLFAPALLGLVGIRKRLRG